MDFFLIYLFVAVLGLEMGSFANVCIYRWPRGGSVVFPSRSHCPWCGSLIKWYDNFPVLSYLLLKGRCRSCRSTISPRYPLVEAFMGLVFLFLFTAYASRFEDSLLFLPALFWLLFSLVVLTLTDVDWKIIPNQISYSLIFAGLLFSGVNPFFKGDTLLFNFLSSLGGCVAGWGGFSLLSLAGRSFFKKEVLGGGDIKLMAGIGAFFGPWGVINTFIYSSMIGGGLVFIGLGTGFLKRNQFIPFGPFLAVGAFLTMAAKIFQPSLLPQLLFWSGR